MEPDKHSFEPSPDLSRDLRHAFSAFGTGVTVVTAQTSNGPLAMTANSFSSISLDPALILWSPARSSKRHEAFVTATRFCVHVLSFDQRAMAEHFATNGHDFSPFEWSDGPLGAPSLAGCLAEFHCLTHAVHPAGDHSLVLGEVRFVVHDRRNTPGLIFEKGRFGHISPPRTTA
jgi:flavin reductase (DIM6/NTAB) family NADH-FMN oxidoreductase RutF